jgi:Large eukaryotic DNA virus major capsid protein
MIVVKGDRWSESVRDPRLAIPSVSIPYGQRFINVTLAQANMILQHQHAYNHAADAPGNYPPPVPDVLTADLWINNVFVNPEIHDIFIKRIGFSLIRVHRRQYIRDNKATDNLLLNQLKWPIETIYCGFRPTGNIDVTSPNLLDSWNIYAEVDRVTVNSLGLANGYTFAAALPATNITADQYTANFVSFTGLALDFAAALSVVGTTVLTVNQLNFVLMGNAYPPLIGTFANASTPTGAEIDAALPSAFVQASYVSYVPTITTITIQAHGVPLYNTIPAPFFNQYIPYTYGGQNVNTPYDVGAYMITFNFYPGSYQPSGHVNISRAREFYFAYTSATVGSSIAAADLSVNSNCRQKYNENIVLVLIPQSRDSRPKHTVELRRHHRNAGKPLEPNSTAPKVARPLIRAPQLTLVKFIRPSLMLGMVKTSLDWAIRRDTVSSNDWSRGPQRLGYGGVRLRTNSKVKSSPRESALGEGGEVCPQNRRGRRFAMEKI